MLPGVLNPAYNLDEATLVDHGASAVLPDLGDVDAFVEALTAACWGHVRDRGAHHMTAVIHSTSTLRYYLLAGDSDLRPLRVFEERQVRWADRQVTFFVLGTSHAIRVEGAVGLFIELLSCVPPATPNQIIEEAAAWSHEAVSRTIDGVRYTCRVGLCEMGQAHLSKSFADSDRLDLAYHGDPGSPEPPRTQIGWRVRGPKLSVETVHTYPQESQAVTSESTFEIADVPV